MNESLDKITELAVEENGDERNLFLPFLNGRLGIAKKFTKPFIDEVKRNVKDYEAEEGTAPSNKDSVDKIAAKRYEFTIPYIFATHESMLASLFEKGPDLIISGRGSKDDEKANKVKATYAYLWDLLDLDTFMNETGWWFLLSGFASCHAFFKSEPREVPATNPDTGEEMFEEDGVTPVMATVYDYNDPVLETDDPEKVYYSPESKYSIDAKKIPYRFRETFMDKDLIEEIYETEVNATDSIEIDGMGTEDKKKYKEETSGCKVYQYYGNIPKKYAEFFTPAIVEKIGEWQINERYYFVFTSSQVLDINIEIEDDIDCRVVKWLGRPNKFFGFGIGKTLHQFQRELSIRRGQEVRYADVCAYAKIALEASTTIDKDALLDPRANVVLTYTEKAPTYLIPPDLSQTLLQTEAKAREDAQFVSGMLDLSKGAQDSKTVQTATGQTIFADSAEKRIKKARKEMGKYLRSVIIMLLKLCQKNWEETKMMTITDEDGNEEEVEVTKDDFKDINFDTDIDIDLDSITVNKEVMRQQVIDLYDKTKDDPLIERKKIFKLLLREGFNIKNPDSYIKPSGLEPGMILVNEATGESFTVGEDGEIAPTQAAQELATPSSDPTAQSQSGALNVQS